MFFFTIFACIIITTVNEIFFSARSSTTLCMFCASEQRVLQALRTNPDRRGQRSFWRNHPWCNSPGERAHQHRLCFRHVWQLRTEEYPKRQTDHRHLIPGHGKPGDCLHRAKVDNRNNGGESQRNQGRSGYGYLREKEIELYGFGQHLHQGRTQEDRHQKPDTES